MIAISDLGGLWQRSLIVRPDGTVRWVASRGVMLRGAEGRVVRTIGTLRDVTTRRSAQEQLERFYEAYRKSLAHLYS